MHLRSLISTEEGLRVGGDVIPGDTMIKDGGFDRTVSSFVTFEPGSFISSHGL